MRSEIIIIAGVRFQNSAQMCLAQDNDVVHTFTPDRSDQPFGKSILPRRGWCGRHVADAHCAQSACDYRSIDTIERLRDLDANRNLQLLEQSAQDYLERATSR